MKKCSKCLIEKELFDFHLKKSSKDGHVENCKICISERLKTYYLNNRQNIIEKNISYRKNNEVEFKKRSKELLVINKTKNSERRKKNYEINKSKILVAQKLYHNKNKDSISQRRKELYLLNKEKINLQSKNYRNNNKQKISQINKEYCKNNSEKIKVNKRLYKKNRIKNDPLFKMRQTISCRTAKAFKTKKWIKGGSTENLLGERYEVVFKHLESLFQKGMNWNNHGEWHIDHIMPLASAKNISELKSLCHYKNLQPLWKEENLKKKDRILINKKGELQLLLI